MKMFQEKHSSPLPTPRGIRRACSNELYRTVKRLKQHVPAPLVREAEELYFKRVIGNLMWISENKSNRKKLADWWEEEVSGDIAQLWNVDRTKLTKAFREAFGG
ncbi:dehydrogenase [Cohnella sp. CIP 111063]|uniref:dehydrogenase n=1 Tax=unclassified Cohnella TaxID=2636738 RepID=UPI000B8C2904|nr:MULTISPECIES: dehydrogenase [unclassified Cohnella]OXS52366.1 dehydrogenase [Cohnella sp. CIP 111063]PRX58008.1 toxin CptA [Cohnella sp. SGD-V74]